MSNTVFALLNISTLIMLGGLILLSYRLKRKSKNKPPTLSELQKILNSQDIVIHHLSQVIKTMTYLLNNISYMLDKGSLNATSSHTSQGLSLAFKEVASRVHEHISNKSNNYNYTLLVGDCFNDTENCMLILNTILENCTTTSINDTVKYFKKRL